jgi:recombination protein RecA
VYSEEGVGKTSFVLQALAGCQRDGGIAVIAETEQALDSQRAAVFGCDLDRVILLQPGSIEETAKSIEATLFALPHKGPPHLIAWDSIAATPTEREIEEGLEGKEAIGERARALSKACRLLCPLAVKKRTVLLFVNQIREKIGVMFGDNMTTPGGRAVKFHSSIRIQMFSGKSVKEGKEHLGKTVTFMAAKNKTAVPWRKAQVRLDYATGWDNLWSTVTHAKEKGAIEKSAKAIANTHKEALESLGWEPGIQSASPGSGDETSDDD